MTASLLLISLGPVQDFIASARRCQDLWYGSWLLSELARHVATVVETRVGGESVIFPASLQGDSSVEEKPAVGNKILVKVSGQWSCRDVAEQGKSAMLARLVTLANHAFDRVLDKHNAFDRSLALQQVVDLIEYQWVAVTLQSEEAYSKTRARAEELLAARKNARTWIQVPWTHDDKGTPRMLGVPKSSLDGMRESVLHEKLYTRSGTSTINPEQLRKSYFVKPAERLCGIGLLKRVGAEPAENSDLPQTYPVFHSTSHVAAAPLLTRLIKRDGAISALGSYLQTLHSLGVDVNRFRVRAEGRVQSKLGWSWDWRGEAKKQEADPFRRFTTDVGGRRLFLDGYLLFESRLRDILEQYSPVYNAERLNRAVVELKNFFGALGCGGPTPYYCVLLADGDAMGKALDAQPSIQDHKRIGRALDDFSIKCRSIVEEHAGSLIYAGGDDVLALLPLHTAIGCANTLRIDFAERLKNATPGVKEHPTLSIGLGIAHHMDDMAHGRVVAKRAETLAKSYPGKNALGIIVSKRSGADLEVVGGWDEPFALHDRISMWCKLLHAEAIPDKVAFELEESVAPLMIKGVAKTYADAEEKRKAEEEETNNLRNVALSLARRALNRRQSHRGEVYMNQPGTEDDVTEMLRQRVAHTIGDNDHPCAAVTALSHEIQVARTFLEALELAWEDPS